MLAIRKLMLLACVTPVVIGCDAGGQINVQRASVSGKVTLDGKPLEAGAIVFQCDAQGPDGVAVTAFGFVENGSYRIEAAKGPVIGSSRVEFRSKPLQREELEEAVDEAARSNSRRPPQITIVEIPNKYGSDSKLQVELASGENHHDFQLDSKR